MIKIILWDFDGVIINSMIVKGQGFVELFKDYSLQHVRALEKYHYSNGGVSRFDKIKYFYEKILKKNITKKKIFNLSDKFAHIINKRIFNKKILIQESLNFIKKNYKKYDFHIVSGAEHNELNKLCDYFKINKYFKSISGSPIKKNTLIQKIIKDFKYNASEMALIGDSMTDYHAAKKNKVKFYGYNNEELKKYGNYIEKFKRIEL